MERFTYLVQGYLGELNARKYRKEKADEDFTNRYSHWVKWENYIVVNALIHCKNFEEIAKMISNLPTEKGGKRGGIKVAGVKRRAEKGFKEMKILFDEIKADLDKKK